MKLSRTLFTLSLLALLQGGCQPFSTGSSPQALDAGYGPDGAVVQRDDDTFSGRLKTGTRQVTDAVAKPFDPETRQLEKQRAQQIKQQKAQQEALARRRQGKPQRSALSNWLFPEPKQPRTLSEWLSQDRPGS